MNCSIKNPTHYSRWKIEPIEFIRANNLDFARANIIKYIMRHDDKDGLKDLEKAVQYLDWLIEDHYGLDAGPYMVDDGELIMAERALYDQEDNPQGQAFSDWFKKP